MRKPLRIGETVKPYGEVAAIGTLGGERYYWFVIDDSKPGIYGTRWGTQTISMMPACAVERADRQEPDQ